MTPPLTTALYQPAKIGFAYLIVTLLLFQFGPMIYPGEGRLLVLVFITLAFACMAVGYRLGIGNPPPIQTHTDARTFMVVGAILSVIALWPSAEAYTGRSPLDLMEALGDQSSTYAGLGERLAETEGTRTWVVILRMFTQPFAYAAIPLSVIFWDRGWLPKATLAASAGAYIVFSILRGTDREIADLLVLMGSGFLVRAMRERLAGLPKAGLPVKKLAIAALAVFMIGGALLTFTSHKEGRLGTISSFCMASSGACSDYYNPLVVGLPDGQKFGATMATTYLTNGYYGLQIALTKPWEPTFGLGHSGAVMRVYQAFTQDFTLSYHTFNYRSVDEGWPSEYFWSSMITSLANDVSFPGSLVLLVGFGWLWSRSWVSATYGLSDPAAIVFCLCMQTIFYFSANLQVLQTLDGYSTVLVWLVLWSLASKRLS